MTLLDKWHELSIKGKLALYLLVPAISASIFIIIGLYQQTFRYVDAKNTQAFLDASSRAAELVYELQKERGLSEGVNAGIKLEYYERIRKQRELVDAQLGSFRRILVELSRQSEDSFVDRVLESFDISAAQLHSERDKIDTFTSANAFEFYSDFINQLLRIIQHSQVVTLNLELSHSIELYAFLVSLQEQAGQERAKVNFIILDRSTDIKLYSEAGGNIANQNALLHGLTIATNIHLFPDLIELIDGFSSPEVNSFRQAIFGRSRTEGTQIDILDRLSAKQWWEVSTARIDNFSEASEVVFKRIMERSQEIQNKTLLVLSLYAVIALVTFLLTTFFAYLLMRRLVGDVRDIASTMNNMQQTGQFDQQISVKGDDEIAKMIQAYNGMVVEREASHKELRLAAEVFRHANEAIIVTSPDNTIEAINPAFERITGYRESEILGKNPSILGSGRQNELFYRKMWSDLHRKGAWQGEVWNRKKDGTVYLEWLSVNVIKNEQGEVLHHIGLFEDITRRKEIENDVWRQANFDSLTNLPNRKMMMSRLEQEILRDKRQGQGFSVMFIDLDHFKMVNDTLGHSAGDQLLQQVSVRLVESVRNTDIVARLGGDEFVVILLDTISKHAITRIAKCILKNLHRPFFLEQKQEVNISGSIGVTLCPRDGRDVETLLKNADTAMYRAKDAGRNNLQFFTEAMNTEVVQHVQVEQELRSAIAESEFVLHYQPIVDLNTLAVVGVEALVRWNHPEKGLVGPDQFIRLAEENGMIIAIGEWALKRALRDSVIINSHRPTPIKFAVNFSSRQFQSPNYSIQDFISRTLSETGANGDYLQLEITESLLMDRDQETSQGLDIIKQLGINIHLDDFGTGYSSLSYLKQYPIDLLKIDKSFVCDLERSRDSASLVKGIISMGKSLGLGVISEGIETQAQLKFLREAGCELGQGFYFAKPMDRESLERHLAKNAVDVAERVAKPL